MEALHVSKGTPSWITGMSKARTLQFLSLQAKGFVVDPFVCFTVKEWSSDRTEVLNRILFAHLGPVVIVRSSALAEDVSPALPPGTFHTELGVPVSSEGALATAIDRVIESYHRCAVTKGQHDLNGVTVQHQLLLPKLSGVLTSRDPVTGGPYYRIEFDDETGRTDTVTAGGSCKRIHIFRNAPTLMCPWDIIITAAQSVEEILKCDDLIVEFALSQDKQVHIFQARRRRPLGDKVHISDSAIERMLHASVAHVCTQPSAVWSDMADWNPAEMLGDRPHPLDISLYQHLITDKTWAWARASLGYTDVRPNKLMEVIACKPFINVDTAFQSLTPSELPAELKRRLIEGRLVFLREHPELHDKVELEVVFTCADPALPRRTQTLREVGFSEADTKAIEESLYFLTSVLLRRWETLLDQDTVLCIKLSRWRQKHPLRLHTSAELPDLADYIYLALSKCKQWGIFPFARLARLAFIARDLMNRLIVAGAFDQSWLDAFWASFRTVASTVAMSLRDVSDGNITRQNFNDRYGHLRPHTYDITSPRYDQIDLLPQQSQGHVKETPILRQIEHAKVLQNIARCLERANLPSEPTLFLRFVKAAVIGREDSKFVFSAVLSDSLEAIAAIGDRIGITRAELAYLTLDDVLLARDRSLTPSELRKQWVERITERHALWQIAKRVLLPPVIRSADDLFLVRPLASRPNFITSSVVEGTVVALAGGVPGRHLELDGNIVAIEAADPGFDWLFSRNIGALVTRFGGLASHMAIRCAEFGIPAVIGCGEELFQNICSAIRIRIDCGNKEILILEP